MNFLLPQERPGTLRDVRTVDIHSDHYLDLWIEFDEPTGETRRGRLPVSECPTNLVAGERVSVKFVMGVMVKVGRPEAGVASPGDNPSSIPPLV
ncbi:MAG: hypothetical protein ABIS67_06190 [Candidatus Eisenbacteria bacterium]